MQNITAQIVIDSARRFLGWKYRAGGRDDYGIDCGGLLVLICRELEVTNNDVYGYAQSPDGETFEAALLADLDELDDKFGALPGDVIACDYGAGIQHIAIVTKLEPKLTVLHAKRAVGVVEQFLHGYDQRAWTKTFRIRGIEN